MFDKLKKLFSKKEVEKPIQEAPPKPKPKKELSPKEQATLNGEPYIQILAITVDPDEPHNGTFELDYNDKFVLNLIRRGYKLKEDDTDNIIVDRWFTSVCRNIALEMYEQYEADPSNREMMHRDMRTISRKNIGNGRSEIS